MTALFCGYFDTTSGAKTDSAAYARIAGEIGRDPRDILFLSDTEVELDAATAASSQVAYCTRPVDARADTRSRYPAFTSCD